MSKKYKISLLTPTLKKKLCLWDRYEGKGVNGYEKFLTYLHSGGVKKYFDDVELDNIFTSIMRQDTVQQTFVLQDDKEVKSFVATRLEYEDLKNAKVYIQCVATHPKEQNKGYATKLIRGILKKPDRYFGLKPALVYGLVKKTNIASKSVFQKLGNAEIEQHDEEYDIISVKLSYDKNGKEEKGKTK